MMQTIVDHIDIVVIWTVMLVTLTAVLTHRQRHQSMHIVKLWLFLLFLSLFVTMQLDVMYVAIDRFVRMNNLSWLLAYLFGITAIYFLCSSFCSQMPRWVLPYLAVTAGLLVALFPFGPGSTPECVDHITPSNAAELLFLGVYYVYGIITLMIPTWAFVQVYRSKKETPVRMRTSVILLALAATITFYVTKLVVFSLSFLVPSLPLSFVLFATDVTRILGGGQMILCALSFLPNQFYRALFRPIAFFQKVLVLRELSMLRSRLDHLCAMVSPIQATWLEQLRSPDLHIYRGVIELLDGRRVLDFWFSRNVPDGIHWDNRMREEAARLHQGLESIPSSLDFDQLVTAFRDLNRQMGRPL